MLVWFNHPSILPLAKSLPPQPLEIGCNFFYKVRPTHHITVYDPRTILSILQDTKNTNLPETTFWTRNGARHDNFNQCCVPLRINPQDSGTLAIAVGIFYLEQKHITIVGCGWSSNETSSLFDQYYTHNKKLDKVSNSKLQLVRRYQSEYNVKIRFVSDTIIDPAFEHESVADLQRRLA